MAQTMNGSVSIERLYDYVCNNEVVYQVCGELIELANEKQEENKTKVLDYIKQTSTIEICKKNDCRIKDEYQELNDWSLKDDLLFLLHSIGVLICIAQKDTLSNHLIAA